MHMKYQIELKVHGQKLECKTNNPDFAIFLNRALLDDFALDKNNTRVTALRSYVKVCYQLFLQEQVAKWQ